VSVLCLIPGLLVPLGVRPLAFCLHSQAHTLSDCSSPHPTKRYDRGSWNKLPGSARTANIGADGELWIIDRSNKIFRYREGAPSGSEWQQVNGTAVDVTVGHGRAVYVISEDREVYKWTGAVDAAVAWVKVSTKPAEVVQISAAYDGTLVGRDEDGNFLLHTPETLTFQPLPGGASIVSCGNKDNLLVANDLQQMYVFM
jgi:hypothetical protein